MLRCAITAHIQISSNYATAKTLNVLRPIVINESIKCAKIPNSPNSFT